MKFVLKIKVGNDAMITAQNIRDAVQEVIDELPYWEFVDGEFGTVPKRAIRDVNGNKVGHWGVK